MIGCSLALSTLHTQNNPHCETSVGEADKKFEQPQGTQVGGWVPETLGHRLNFSPLSPKIHSSTFPASCTVLQILFHLLCSHHSSKLFFIDFSLRWNGSRGRVTYFLPAPPAQMNTPEISTFLSEQIVLSVIAVDTLLCLLGLFGLCHLGLAFCWHPKG